MDWNKPKSKMDRTRLTSTEVHITSKREWKVRSCFGNLEVDWCNNQNLPLNRPILMSAIICSLEYTKSIEIGQFQWRVFCIAPILWGIHSLPKCRWHWGKLSRTASGTPRNDGGAAGWRSTENTPKVVVLLGFKRLGHNSNEINPIYGISLSGRPQFMVCLIREKWSAIRFLWYAPSFQPNPCAWW